MDSKKPSNDLSINKVKSLSLYELIGAPLQALVQAEAAAMASSIDYISQIGFEKDEDDGDKNKFGKLKMVSIEYQSTLPDGTLVDRVLSVPLLTLVPIPFIAVKNAEIEFSLKITDFYFQKSNEQSPKTPNKSSTYMSTERAAMKATMGSTSTVESSSSKYQIRVKMNVEQSDMPSGVTRLLQRAEEATNVQDKPKRNDPKSPEETEN